MVGWFTRATHAARVPTVTTSAAIVETSPDAPSSSCVVSGAWGSFRQMLNETRVTKVEYAATHGYRYLEYAHESVDGFAADCGAGCAVCNQSAAALAVGKFCAVKRAFASGCEWVLWVDADNAIFDSSRDMASLAARAGADAQQTGTPWAVFGYQTGSAHPDVGISTDGCDALAASVECGDASRDFGLCVNSGVFLVARGDDAARAIDFMLGVELDPTALAVDSAVWSYQCRSDGAFSYNDQCALAYYTENGLETTDGYRCLPATSELDTPSTSPLQNYASSYFADTNLTLDTDAFVNACVWGSTADTRFKCVKVT